MANTFYENDMARLSAEYNSYLAQARNTNRRNGYIPSKTEYEFYVKASETARKIAAMNTSQRALNKQWTERAHSCEKKALELLNILVPKNPEPDEEKSASSASSSGSAKTASSPGSKPAKAGTTVTTASGFSTKNASDDVSAETIEKWYMPMPDHGFDDIVGMDDLKTTIKEEILDNIGWESTDDLLDISQLKSCLFYGPFGTGKSFFIEAVARELMLKGYKFIQLRGSDVHDSYVGVGEKVVNTAFQEAVDNAPCVLFFDEFENMCRERSSGNSEGHEKRLSVAFMESFNIILNSKKPIVFLAATNYPDQIEHAMLSRINTYIQVPLPSEEVRSKYFANVLKNLTLEEGFTTDDMADVTDNYSFRDLYRLTSKLKSVFKGMARDTYSVYDDDGNRLHEESDRNVVDAIRDGKVILTRDLFMSVFDSVAPEKKSDILASIEEFEKKI